MPILSIKHVTTYHYKRAVAFGEHRMMLRPRDDDDQKVIESELEITPSPKQLAWTRDSFGNHVATAYFGDRACELRFATSIRLDHAPGDFRSADINNFARTYPFAYAPEDWPELERFLSRCLRIRRLISGAPRSSVRMAQQTLTSCSAT
ncbi:MAG: transglutaminase N-terminal domain-containing protein [Xanthobacteraceae bacterium]